MKSKSNTQESKVWRVHFQKFFVEMCAVNISFGEGKVQPLPIVFSTSPYIPESEHYQG